MLKRYKGNPILAPKKENPWESIMVYNCAAIYEGGKVHIVYRAQGAKTGISRLGYASSTDGFNIDERLDYPIFGPSGEHSGGEGLSRNPLSLQRSDVRFTASLPSRSATQISSRR